MKPPDVKSNTYIDLNKENNNEDPKFEVVDYNRTSRYKNIIEKSYIPSWSEEAFMIKKVRSTVPCIYLIRDLNGEEIVVTFYKKELQKTNRKVVRVKKVKKREGDKLCVK